MNQITKLSLFSINRCSTPLNEEESRDSIEVSRKHTFDSDSTRDPLETEKLLSP